jgi:murein DD-endopeptidase MepM/ murein hydrolase activator NlpD
VASRRQQNHRRTRSSKERRNSIRISVALAALTAVNVYVFFFREDTSVNKLMKPQSSERAVIEVPADKSPADSGSLAKLATPANDKVSATSTSASAASVAANPPKPGDLRIVEGTIGENDTLGAVIEREGMGPASGNVLRALSRLHDPKSIRPGDRYAVTFDAEGTPTSFEYRPSLILRYTVTAKPDGSWSGTKEERPLTVKAEETGATIQSSLYESVSRAKETPALVGQLVDIFAWDIDFYIDTHPGDHWKIVVEKHYLDNTFYRYGNILAAEYSGKVGTFRAFAWNSADGRGPMRYFDEKGQAIAKSFLKTPLRFVRISSKFDRNRFHPILHRTKAHLGVDYAAPTGTPIWASASGKVVECVRKPGSGNTVVIQHGNGLATRYYHLHRFAPGMRAGRQVRQKELIGYVGTTGLSTGPHLHFAVTKNGAFVDPTKLAAVREAPVADRTAFQAAIKQRLAILNGRAPVTAGR